MDKRNNADYQFETGQSPVFLSTLTFSEPSLCSETTSPTVTYSFAKNNRVILSCSQKMTYGGHFSLAPSYLCGCLVLSYAKPLTRSTKRIKDYNRLDPCCPCHSVLQLHLCLLRSVRGWFHWLLSVANEDSGGAGVLQLNHTVLNMTLDSTEALVSLWLLSGGQNYWSEWQIKAGNWAGGCMWGGRVLFVYLCVCMVEKKTDNIESNKRCAISVSVTYNMVSTWWALACWVNI